MRDINKYITGVYYKLFIYSIYIVFLFKLVELQYD